MFLTGCMQLPAVDHPQIHVIPLFHTKSKAMDQGHGNSIGWDPSGFAGESWDHQFGGSALGFDQGAGADSSYPNPDFLDGGAINPQLSGADPQAALYRPFDYYNQGEVWPDHPQTTAAPFAQDASLRQGYFGEPRHPTDGNQTIDSRFAHDIQQGNGFQPQLHSDANQVNAHHGFGHGVANASNPTPNGYPQGSIPQWQEQVPAGYASGHQFENPLTAAQTSSMPGPGSNGSSSSFFAGHGAGTPSPMPGYQAEVHQQAPVNARQVHPQFAAGLNGQSQQPGPVANGLRVQPPRKAASQQLAHQARQHVVQQAIPQQQPIQQPAQRQAQQAMPQQQPVQQSPPRPVQQQQLQQQPQQPAQHPVQRPASQSGPGQHVFAQQPISQPQPVQRFQQPLENNLAAGVKRSSTSEPQAIPVAAKKAKVFAPAASHSPSPSVQAQVQNAPEPICTIHHQDTSLLAAAKGRPGARWGGVPNLVIGPAPVKLQKGTPTKRYVTLSTKGGKDPLFSKLWRAWTPAESLGNHADAYQKATSDLDRQRADLRLEIEMRRGKTGKSNL
jgi:hypothetical protein